MNTALRFLGVLPWIDWVAVGLFFPAWFGYAVFACRRVGHQPSILATTNRVLLIGAAPEASRFRDEGLSREAFADKAGRIVGMAAETFNDGLRAYYFSFAVIGWFFSPILPRRDRGRGLDPLPARVPLRRASGAQLVSRLRRRARGARR